MTNVEIGYRIYMARKENHATLEEVAKKVGLAKSTIQRYEKGLINDVKLPNIQSIAKALNVNPNWIIGKSEEMHVQTQIYPKIIDYYNQLNDFGKKEATKRVEELTHFSQYTESQILNAAHERTDIDIPTDIYTSDNDIMDDENF